MNECYYGNKRITTTKKNISKAGICEKKSCAAIVGVTENIWGEKATVAGVCKGRKSQPLKRLERQQKRDCRDSNR